jgi:hypothetical protein
LIEEHAAKAMRHHPFMSEADLLMTMLNGYSTLYLATEDREVLGFAAMEVLNFPSRRVANVLAAGGRRGFLGVLTHSLLGQLEKWAIEQGADTFAVMGRPGWLKYAKQHEGAISHHVFVSQKRLGNVGWRRDS